MIEETNFDTNHQISLAQKAESNRDFDGAIEMYKRIIKSQLTPAPQIFMALAQCYALSGDLVNAAGTYEKAYGDEARPAYLNENLAQMFIELADFDRARYYNEFCIKMSKPPASAMLRQANLMRWQGDLEGSQAYLTKVIQIYPDNAKLLATAIDDNVEAVDITAARTRVEDSGLSIEDRRYLAFALTRYFDKQGDCDTAWSYADKANSLYPEASPVLGLQLERALLERSIECYRALSDTQNSEGDMIYIVGAPRTGGTLLQTVLARSAVLSSVGERAALMSWLPELSQNPQRLESMREDLSRADIAGMKALHPKADTFVDKTPHHILVVGLLKKIHPRAKFICPTRNSADVAVSIYFHDFNAAYGYARRIDTIEEYLNFHDHAMHWWQDEGQNIHTFPYADMLANPDQSTSDLFEKLELPYATNVLEPSKEDGHVMTFSARQVRDGISQKFQGRGRRYARHLKAAGFSGATST